ncbi:MAG TPA: hypothetical protein PK748_08415 [Acidimicrobiales bacterium]|nr:hypothetical protein [Acidimicrobiales bacterium]HRA34939.1 hypothetical protein [Acidimicrobiales bacterium]
MVDLPELPPRRSDDPTGFEPEAPPAVPPASTSADPTVSLEVGLAAFLPEGVEIGDPQRDDLVTPDLATDDPLTDDPLTDDSLTDDPLTDDAAPAETGGLSADAAPTGAAAPVDDEHIDLELLGRLEADLDAVGVALAALDDGSYGSCAVCGAVLPPPALAVDPVRRSCDAHLPSIA